MMFFNFGIKNKTVKELRKNQGFTARELALRVKVDTSEILAVDSKSYSRSFSLLKRYAPTILSAEESTRSQLLM